MVLEQVNNNLFIISNNTEETVEIEALKEDKAENNGALKLPNLFQFLIEPAIQLENFDKITSLNLSHCNLKDIPKNLKFTLLTNLNLSHNQLEIIPKCFYGGILRNLEILDLSFNLIRNFNVEPDCTASLKTLLLNNNNFSNIPSWFLTFRAKTLEELNYSENKAEHYNFLPHYCNFKEMKLKKLVLENSCLINSDISWLKNFKNLQYLNLSNNINEAHPRTHINKLQNLELLFSKPLWTNLNVLVMNNLKLAFFPEDIFWLGTLTEIYATNNLFTWLPDGIEYLQNLEILDLSDNRMLFLSKEISQLNKLRVLLAPGNKLDIISDIPKNVEILDLYDNRLANISNVEHVKLLDLDYNIVNLHEINNKDHQFDFESYVVKREELRKKFNFLDRVKTWKRSFVDTAYRDENERYDSENSEDYSEEEINDYNKFYVTKNDDDDDDDEDWNSEYKLERVKNPEITSSDEEFDDSFRSPKEVLLEKTVFYSDTEDWMFEDFEDAN